MIRRERPLTVAVLKAQSYGAWNDMRTKTPVAGSLGPYSVDYLERSGFTVRYSDGAASGAWSRPRIVRAFDYFEYREPLLRGLRNTLASREEIRDAAIVLALFEDQGAALAALAGVRRRNRRQLVALVVCWLAERAQHADEKTLKRYRRIVAGADVLFYFSSNQTDIFRALLGARREQLVHVPFGVDVDFFAATPQGDNGLVVSVGADASRDFGTLVSALKMTEAPARIFAPATRMPAGVVLPDNVDWTVDRISHAAYRQELAQASIVVVPTHALAYPGGQTVVVEAMAAGKALITTDSPSIREYVTHGVSGLLVPKGDPPALAHAIAQLMGSSEARARLGAAAQKAAHANFSQQRMWHEIGDELARRAAA